MVASRTAEPKSVRQRLLAVATKLFAARGFEATPIQDIADEVGVSKPAVLHHFASKEELRREVLEEIFSHWREALPQILLSATSSGSRFDAVLGEVYRFFAAEPDRARFIARECLDRPEEAQKLLKNALPVLEAVAGYIRVGQEHGRHPDDIDAEAYVLHVLQMVIGAVALADATTRGLGSGAKARARYDRELARIAKTSLFGSAPSDRNVRSGAAPETPKRKRASP